MKLFNSPGFPYTALVTSALAIVMTIVGLSPVPAQTATPSNTQPQQQQLVAAMEAQRAALVVASSQSAACKWTTSLGADAMLKCEMVAGHGGVSGRYNAWHQRAFELAWLLDVLGLAEG